MNVNLLRWLPMGGMVDGELAFLLLTPVEVQDVASLSGILDDATKALWVNAAMASSSPAHEVSIRSALKGSLAAIAPLNVVMLGALGTGLIYSGSLFLGGWDRGITVNLAQNRDSAVVELPQGVLNAPSESSIKTRNTTDRPTAPKPQDPVTRAAPSPEVPAGQVLPEEAERVAAPPLSGSESAGASSSLQAPTPPTGLTIR